MEMHIIRIFKILLTGSCLLLVLMACERSVDQENSDAEVVKVEGVYDLEEHEETSDFTWDDLDIIPVVLSGPSISSDGAGLSINGSTVTITSAGTYCFSGSLSEGQIVVDKEDEEVVRIILDGVDLSSSSTSPLYVRDASIRVLILEEGTEDTVSDASSYTSYEDGPNAAIFSSADLSIYGEGALTVHGNYNDGITSKDGLIIKSGTLKISTLGDVKATEYLNHFALSAKYSHKIQRWEPSLRIKYTHNTEDTSTGTFLRYRA